MSNGMSISGAAPSATRADGSGSSPLTPAPVFVFARMSSSRLPGKALREIGGRPLLSRVIERCRAARHVSKIVVATSSQAEDDPIAELAAREGTFLFRGALDDVAGRALAAACEIGCERFVRISGDSPFVDAETIDAMVGAPENVGADLATNIFPRSSPPGLSVEIIRTQSLAHGLAEGMTPNDREHVTPWFYRNAETLKIVNFRSPDVYPANVRLTVDTLDELIRANEIAARLARPYAAASGLEIARIAAELAATMP